MQEKRDLLICIKCKIGKNNVFLIYLNLIEEYQEKV